MGYPTSVQTFTTKQDGVDYPQASHINLPQTEITAIEDALLNGFAHALTISTGGLTVSTGSVNVSGPSSVNTLQVNGASTFVGAVTFSTVVTFHASQAFAGTRTPMCRVTGSANQAVASGALTGLSWDTETYDSTGIHSTSANSSRLALTSSGLWMIGVQVDLNASSGAGSRVVQLRLNDTTTIGEQTQGPAVDAAIVQCHAPYLATSTTDYVTALVFQASGSTGSVTSSSFFYAHRVSV